MVTAQPTKGPLSSALAARSDKGMVDNNGVWASSPAKERVPGGRQLRLLQSSPAWLKRSRAQGLAVNMVGEQWQLRRTSEMMGQMVAASTNGLMCRTSTLLILDDMLSAGLLQV
jgi:hypothetical protein